LILHDGRVIDIRIWRNTMSLLNRLLTIALGLFLVSAGIAKFTTGHVFQYIEYKSGIDLFHPFVNNLTGIAEILAGLAILYRPARLIGAVGAAALMAGAVAFHLSPWLGISIPTGFTDVAASPWDGGDFAGTTSSGTFVAAVVAAVRAAAIVRSELASRASLGNPDTSSRPDAALTKA
jgi:uncharacterized membrane protein YphA (DoxX/SURF4 family)